jgi:flavorubredoxin
VLELVENVYWVGVRDWDRKIFDALFSLPRGASYNAYLVIGEKASALIDTDNCKYIEEETKVRAGVHEQMIDKLNEVEKLLKTS